MPGDRARFGQSFCCIVLKGVLQIETAGTGGIRARIRRGPATLRRPLRRPL